MNIEQISKRQVLGRKVQGIAAALLPYEQDGRVAVEAFQRHLQFTHRAGLMNAVNMDTGYVNYLSEPEKLEVLRWTRDALGNEAPFVAGAYVEDKPGTWWRSIAGRWMRLSLAARFLFSFRPAVCMERLLRKKLLPTRLRRADTLTF